jgi:hypothetical protein
LVKNASYYALRRRPGASSDAWWVNASRRPDAPPAMLALIAGRVRIELSYEETVEAIAWAERIGGWPTTGASPLIVYPRDPRVEAHAQIVV